MQLLQLPDEILNRIVDYLCPTAEEIEEESFRPWVAWTPRFDLGSTEQDASAKAIPPLFRSPSRKPRYLDPTYEPLPSLTELAKSRRALLRAKALEPKVPLPEANANGVRAFEKGQMPTRPRLPIHLLHPNAPALTAMGSTCHRLREVIRPLLFRTLVIDLWLHDEDDALTENDAHWKPPGRSDRLFEILKHNPKIANDDVKGVLFLHARAGSHHGAKFGPSSVVGPGGHSEERCRERLEKWTRMIGRCKQLRVLAFQSIDSHCCEFLQRFKTTFPLLRSVLLQVSDLQRDLHIPLFGWSASTEAASSTAAANPASATASANIVAPQLRRLAILVPFEIGLSQATAETIHRVIPPSVEHLEVSIVRDMTGFYKMGLANPTGVGLNLSKTYRTLLGIPREALEEQSKAIRDAAIPPGDPKDDTPMRLAARISAAVQQCSFSSRLAVSMPLSGARRTRSGESLRHVQVRFPAYVHGLYDIRETIAEMGDNSLAVQELAQRVELAPFIVPAPDVITQAKDWDEQDEVLRARLLEHKRRTGKKVDGRWLLQEIEQERSRSNGTGENELSSSYDGERPPDSVPSLSFKMILPEAQDPKEPDFAPRVRKRGEPDLWKSAVKDAFTEAGLVWAS